jgi:peptidoglycan/xylan/chitin deacetylase (PgdA/CDA1 family)
MNLRAALKLGLAGLLVDSAAWRLWSRVRAPRIHVLGYHRVVDALDEQGPINPSLCITTDAFRRQMQQVKERFTVLGLGDAAHALSGERVLDGERDACVLTFDDGYRDVLERARPVLAALGLPATVFVPTGYAGRARQLPHDRLYAALWALRRRRRPIDVLPPAAARALASDGPGAAVDVLIAALTGDALERLIAALDPPALDDPGGQVLAPDELRALAEAGWEIGAHTVEHVVLTRDPPARVEHELMQARRDIERWTGRPCRFFAYCNGYHSATLRAAVRRAGYLAAVTTCDRPNGRGVDPLRIGRKVMWQGHACGLDGRWSATASAAHLHDLFGDLGLTRPVDGEVHA